MMLLAGGDSAAQASGAASSSSGTGGAGEGVSVYLLTMGPGEAIWEVWAHNAIWLRDPATGLDVAYNWGMFAFDQEGFLGRLARGTMLYWMQGLPGEEMIAAYERDNRSVWAQELRLTADQRDRLVEYLRATDTPENRYYRYDYYLDNCSTRVRDALDMVLGGRISTRLDTLWTGETWRSHARRILRPMPAAYVGMQFALGSPADGAVTAWDEGFLPMLLMQYLRDVTVPDEEGREVPLVVNEVQLFEADRSPAPGRPPFWLHWFLAAGLALAGLLTLVGPGRGGAVMATGWSLVVGGAGLFLGLAWAFTDHTFWYRNENLFQANPLSLLSALAFLGVALGHGASRRWAAFLALSVAGLSLCGLLLQVLPAFRQMNGEIIAFALPVHLAVAWMALRLRWTARGAGSA